MSERSNVSIPERITDDISKLTLKEVGRIIHASYNRIVHHNPTTNDPFGMGVSSTDKRGSLELMQFFLYAEDWTEDMKESYKIEPPALAEICLPIEDSEDGRPKQRVYTINRDSSITSWDEVALLDTDEKPCDWDFVGVRLETNTLNEDQKFELYSTLSKIERLT